MIIKLLLALILVFDGVFLLWFHRNRDEVLMYVQEHRPSWYTDCMFCQGVHFGYVQCALIITVTYFLLC